MSYRLEDIDPDAAYLVEWPGGSRRLLWGHRIIAYPVGTGATITRLVPEVRT